MFGPDGGLVANAPHIPVHLGAMQETVQYQLYHHKQDLRLGTVILSNHPTAGGSHLPDLNVVTPVSLSTIKNDWFTIKNYRYSILEKTLLYSLLLTEGIMLTLGGSVQVYCIHVIRSHINIINTCIGSMPPNSTHINEEGMAVKSFKLVENGIFQEEGVVSRCGLYDILFLSLGVTELLMSPAQFPGCSGTRNLHDNLSDLRAQVAANQKVLINNNEC